MNRVAILLGLRLVGLGSCLLVTALGAQDRPLTLPPVSRDQNQDPRVFETVLCAAHGSARFVGKHETPAMTFGDSLPGPTIDARVGDTLVVHFVNLLQDTSTIHWHGVGVPAVMDGSQISQTPVPRSGHHRYEFKLNATGTFWYHPHIQTNQKIEAGLYGALIVRDPAEDQRLGIDPADERILFLDDIKLDEQHRIAPFATDLGAQFEPWQRAEELANSRLGNHVLVNGSESRQGSLPVLDVVAGRPYRLRLLNVASGRIFRLDAPNKKVSLTAIGSDQGLWDKPEPVLPIDEVTNRRGHHQELISNPDLRLGILLTPGDRLEVVLVADGKVGEEFELRSHDFFKGKHTAFRNPQGELEFGHDHFDGAEKPEPLLKIRIVAGPARKAPWQAPTRLRSTPTQVLTADPKQPPLDLFFGHSPPDSRTGNVMFFMQVGKPTELCRELLARRAVQPIEFDPRPMMRLRATDGLRVRVGETREIRVFNLTGNDHNLHLHGFRFQHLETEYVDLDDKENNRREARRRLAFEDTIRIPMRPGLPLGRSHTVVRLLARFDDSDLHPDLRRTTNELLAGGLAPGVGSSGGWLLHCHFLEHAANQMMTFIAVER